MEFALSEEQEALLVTAREWAADETQPTARKSDDPDFDEHARFVRSWRQLAELGFLGILVPAEHGGAGGSLLDAILVAQELSARLITIPFSGTAILAVGAASKCAADARDILEYRTSPPSMLVSVRSRSPIPVPC